MRLPDGLYPSAGCENIAEHKVRKHLEMLCAVRGRAQEEKGNSMTYGVYSKDLKSTSIQGLTLDNAKRYCRDGMVVCSEKEGINYFEICVMFHKWWGVRARPSLGYVDIGFVSFSWRSIRYKCADKIVWDGEAK